LRRDGDSHDAHGPGANVAVLDPALVDERLSALLDGLGEVRPEACCAGAAGAEVPAARSHLRALLERRLPKARVCVVHDTRLVLAAAGLDAGIALIAGTGSVAYARAADGREEQRGGWGWMLGDEGSGAWIAREAARLVLARLEGGSPGGKLADALHSRCEVADPRQLIAKMHAMREPMQWAALAEVVFDTAGADAGSRAIIDRAATALAQLVLPLRRLSDGPVVLAGGLVLNQPLLEDSVRQKIATRCIRLEEPPVEGAVRLAAELLR
jgi:N-acetylglucosamine kinase-like BadF-type ATPase